MREYEYKAICHTTCYWLDTLWQPGEVYEGDVPPNKHFSEDGKRDGDLPATSAGEDPRSNATLRKIIKNKYHSTAPQNWPRKKLWQKLKEFEEAERMDALTSGPEENEFTALCGHVAKSNAGLKSHERNCEECKKLKVQ